MDRGIIIKKGTMKEVDSYSGFGTSPEDTGLFKIIQDNGINEVFVCGLAFDYCVGKTALDAAKLGLKTNVIAHAT